MKKNDYETRTLQLFGKLTQAGAITILIANECYLTCGDEIADGCSRRELEALLKRLDVITSTKHLTKEGAQYLCSAITTVGIHLDQWLGDRKYQSDLDQLTRLLAEYTKYGDVEANDTRLRILVRDLAKTHADELRATLSSTPLDTSVHAGRIMKAHPEYFTV